MTSEFYPVKTRFLSLEKKFKNPWNWSSLLFLEHINTFVILQEVCLAPNNFSLPVQPPNWRKITNYLHISGFQQKSVQSKLHHIAVSASIFSILQELPHIHFSTLFLFKEDQLLKSPSSAFSAYLQYCSKTLFWSYPYPSKCHYLTCSATVILFTLNYSILLNGIFLLFLCRGFQLLLDTKTHLKQLCPRGICLHNNSKIISSKIW